MMINKHVPMAIATALLLSVAAVPSSQAAPAGVKVGVLSCKVEPGWSYIVGSTKALSCDYSPSKGRPERYTGQVQKVGVDIGYSEGATMVWAVFAPTSDVGKDALEGDYAGAQASATVGVGVGVNVLVGGFDKSITLQPVSVEGGTGLNLAAGVAAIKLDHI